MINFEDITKVELDFMNSEHEDATHMLNSIESAYKSDDVDAVIHGLQALQAHSIDHFLHEEKEMKAHFYPPYQVHKQEHDRALMELDMLIQQLSDHRDLAKVVGYVMHSLPTWFVHHTATMDRMMAQFIAKESRASA